MKHRLQRAPRRPGTVGVCAAFLLVALATPAVAVDGAVEINQAVVAAAGGAPFRVTESGSYRLTGLILVPGPDVTGIEIEASHVTLDLNGFVIACPACVAAGSGAGVHAAASFENVSVRNGHVRGVGGTGVDLEGPGSQVDGVAVVGARGEGIRVGASSIVTDSSATSGFGDGIQVGRGSAVLSSATTANTGAGIASEPFALLAGNVANGNLRGIAAVESSVLIHNEAHRNFGAAIQTQESVVVESSVQESQGAGIECTDCLVLRCNIVDNIGLGLTGSGSALGDSVLTSNGPGAAQTDPGVLEVSGNVCGFSLGCP